MIDPDHNQSLSESIRINTLNGFRKSGKFRIRKSTIISFVVVAFLFTVALAEVLKK